MIQIEIQYCWISYLTLIRIFACSILTSDEHAKLRW
uniref:Uncharacterized protein n=1 Tax=Zea mays TaxID=4577 RepID=C4IYV0_MAIZE|nr:unknown [Zea mays]